MAKQRVYRHDALCPKCASNWVKKDGHSRGKQIYKCNQCGVKHQEGAKHRFTDEQKERAVKMCAEGMIPSKRMSLTRALGEDVRGGDEPIGDSPRNGRERNHCKQVGQKKGALATEHLTRFLEWRTSGRRDSVRASIVAFDEMWTYLEVRCGERRQDLWIWTAVVEERDGVRWRMYEVGGRDVSAFSRLLDRLPGADMYETDAYPIYEWLPWDRHIAGKEGAVNWNDGLRFKLRSKLNRLVMSTFEECLNQSLKSISAMP